MSQHEIRLIAMDMDGTLLNSKQQISDTNANVLRECATQSIKLALCSGRPAGDIAQFALATGLTDCALLSLNGTYNLSTPLSAPFGNHCMDGHMVAEVLSILSEERMSYSCHAQNSVALSLADDEDPERFWLSRAEGLLVPRLFYGEDGLRFVLSQGVNKFVTFAHNEDMWLRVREKLQRVPKLMVSCSWPLDFELMQQGYDKGSAVMELADMLGFDASQVMTLGDYDNDVSMIACAGLGVAMGNASEAARKAAKWQTRSNDEDGVAYAIRRWALHQ